MEHDVRFNFEGSSEDETPGLEVKEFDGSILGQVRDRLDEELDEEVDREDGRFPRQVVVKNFSVQLQPEQQNQFWEKWLEFTNFEKSQSFEWQNRD